MTNQNIQKIRTVTVNDRGQIVIPDDIRKDLNIESLSTLILILNNKMLTLKKESELLGEIKLK
jgi:AbrB family looped-hinge helix DNA binding protein